MNIIFEDFTEKFAKEVMDIFNYYIENSFAAYPENRLPITFFGKLQMVSQGYPAYVIKDIDTRKVVGFCMLKPYSPLTVFNEAAEVSYFIDQKEVAKGIGRRALTKLEEDARKLNIRVLLANISGENEQSINFHLKNGFQECGRLHDIGKKKYKIFDVVWMEKKLS
jgi:phosphinothricin acetyltransferase